MGAFDNDYDITKPTGSEDANTLDNIIRALKDAIDERQSLEHRSYESGTNETSSTTAMGRHIPGKVGCLFYGTWAELQALNSVSVGAIGYSTSGTYTGFFHRTASAWIALAWTTGDVIADDITLAIAGSAPGTLGMKHDNQQWTETAVLVDGANIATNCDDSNSFSVTLGGNRVLDNPTNLKAGATYVWIVTQDGTGGRTLSYGAKFKWPGGIDPILTTAAGSVDIITAISDGTDVYCSVIYDLG